MVGGTLMTREKPVMMEEAMGEHMETKVCTRSRAKKGMKVGVFALMALMVS